MQGYDNTSYGEAFADVYDEWYGDLTDVTATVEALAALAAPSAPRPVVELGVGTGRIAIPLAERLQPRAVAGIDSSEAMLARLRAKNPPPNLGPVLGDMVDGLAAVHPDDELGLVVVAFNTFFNLATVDLQQDCFRVVAARLVADGCFVIEAFVPDEPAPSGDHIEVRSLSADHVVLSVARYDDLQHVAGQFVEFSESGGVRLRPYSIRYTSPSELDAMARSAGFVLRSRWESFAGDDYTDESPHHVSVYIHPAG